MSDLGSDGGSERVAEAQLLEGLATQGRRSVHLELLADRRYRRYFLATLFSSTGDWIGVLAILALTETVLQGNARVAAFGVSGVMVARILPTMILGPVAGVYADRWDRKRTLIATDIGRGLVMAAIPFSQDFLQLFVASFIVEVMAMLFAPAKEATLPNLVPPSRLVEANQLTLIVTFGTFPLGGLVFAILAGAATSFGPVAQFEFLRERPEALAIWVNALTFFASAVLFLGVDIPRGHGRASTETVPGTWEQVKEGLRFIASRPAVRALVAGIMAAFFAGGVVITLADLLVKTLRAGPEGFGVLVASFGLGLLAGLLSSAPICRLLGEERVFAPGVVFGGVFAIATALMPRADLAWGSAFLMGIGAGLAIVTGYTLLQRGTEDAVRGRAFAAFSTGIRLALFASVVLAPLVAGVIGPGTLVSPGYRLNGIRLTIAAGGLVAVAGGLFSAMLLERVRRERQLDLSHPVAAEDVEERRGVFVVFEGGEGAGKTTQIRLLRAAIERAGREVVVTREPGGTPLGERLRATLLDPSSDIGDRAEALLYAAERAQHVDDVIRPALMKGAVVLCDRFVASSIAYQGVARGLGEHHIEELSRWATRGLQPDLAILLDIDAVEGLRRAGDAPDRLEGQGVSFHRAVNGAFRRIAAADPLRWLVLDATRPVEDLHSAIRNAVLRLLPDDDAAAIADEEGER